MGIATDRDIGIRISVVDNTKRALSSIDKDAKELRKNLELLSQKTVGTKGLKDAIIPSYAPATKEVEKFNRATAVALDTAIGKTRILEKITNRYIESLEKQTTPISSAQLGQAEKMMNTLAASNQRVISLQDKLTDGLRKEELATRKARSASINKFADELVAEEKASAIRNKKWNKFADDLIKEEKLEKKSYLDRADAQRKAEKDRIEKTSRMRSDSNAAFMRAIDVNETRRKQIYQQIDREEQQRERQRTRRAAGGGPGGPRGFNPPWAQNATIRAFQDIEARMSLLTARIAMFTFVFRTVFNTAVNAITPFIEQAREAERSFLGLQQTAKAFGVSADAAKKAAFELAKDGFLTASEAAEGLKRLIGTGFNLEQSTKLMKGATDSAVFNAQAHRSVSEAVLDFTEALRTGRSQVLDNAGVIENLSQIMVQAGLSLNDFGKITESAEIRGKFFNRMMVILGRTMGNAEMASKTFIGAQNRLRNAWINLLIVGGETITQNKQILATMDKLSEMVAKFGSVVQAESPDIQKRFAELFAGVTKYLDNLDDRFVKFAETPRIIRLAKFIWDPNLEDLGFAIANKLGKMYSQSEFELLSSQLQRRLTDMTKLTPESLAIIQKNLKDYSDAIHFGLMEKEAFLPGNEPVEFKESNKLMSGIRRFVNEMRSIFSFRILGSEVKIYDNAMLDTAKATAITTNRLNELGISLLKLQWLFSIGVPPDIIKKTFADGNEEVEKLIQLLMELGILVPKVAKAIAELKVIPFSIDPTAMEKFMDDMKKATGTAMDQVSVELKDKWKEFAGTIKLDEAAIRKEFAKITEAGVSGRPREIGESGANELLEQMKSLLREGRIDEVVTMLRSVTPASKEAAEAFYEAEKAIYDGVIAYGKFSDLTKKQKISDPIRDYARELEMMTAGPLRQAVLENQKLTEQLQEHIRLYKGASPAVRKFYQDAMAKNLSEAHEKLNEFKMSLLDTDSATFKMLKGIADIGKAYRELGTDGADALGDISALMEGKTRQLIGADLTKDIETHVKSMRKTVDDEYQKAEEDAQALIDKQKELEKSFEAIKIALQASAAGFGSYENVIPGAREEVEKLGNAVKDSAERTMEGVSNTLDVPKEKDVEDLKKLFKQVRDAMAQVTETKEGRRANRFQDLIDQLEEARGSVNQLVIAGEQVFTESQINQMIGNLQRLGDEGVQQLIDKMNQLEGGVHDVEIAIAEGIGGAFSDVAQEFMSGPLKQLLLGEKFDIKETLKGFAGNLIDTSTRMIADQLDKMIQKAILEPLLQDALVMSPHTMAVSADTAAFYAHTTAMGASSAGNIGGGTLGSAGGAGLGGRAGMGAAGAGAGAGAGTGLAFGPGTWGARGGAGLTGGGAAQVPVSEMSSGLFGAGAGGSLAAGLGYAGLAVGATLVGKDVFEKFGGIQGAEVSSKTSQQMIEDAFKLKTRSEIEAANRRKSFFGKFFSKSKSREDAVLELLQKGQVDIDDLERAAVKRRIERYKNFWKEHELTGEKLFRDFPDVTTPTIEQSFQRGGMIFGSSDRVPIIAHRGEAVLSRRGVNTLGGSQAVDELNKGKSASTETFVINITVNGSSDGVEDKIAQAVEKAILRNSEIGRRTVHDRGRVITRR